jgi:hypothetical protein
MTQKLMVWWAGARAGLMTALVLAAAGCGSTDATAPTPPDLTGKHTPDLTGTYTLLNVSGASLPATVYEGPLDGVGPDAKVVVVSSTLTLDSSGRYTASIRMDATASSGEAESCCTDADAGRYEKNGSALTLISDDPEGPPIRCTIIADAGVVEAVIDLAHRGKPLTYVYRK